MGNRLLEQEFYGTPRQRSAEVRRWWREFEHAARVALLQDLVARSWGVSLEEIKAPTRQHARAAFARQVGMYLGHVAFGLSLSAIGRHFGRDRTTAAHACRLVEDKRDDRDLDMVLTCLEQALVAVPRAFDRPPGHG